MFMGRVDGLPLAFDEFQLQSSSRPCTSLAPTPRQRLLSDCLGTPAATSVIMDDQKNFKEGYLNKLPEKASADFMLCGDCSTNRANHMKLDARVKVLLGGVDMFAKCVEATCVKSSQGKPAN